jgi:hypothetical protein
MNKTKYLDLDSIKGLIEGRYVGKYVTFKTKYLKKSELADYSRYDLRDMYGKRFNTNFNNCIDIFVNGVNGDLYSIRDLIYDLSQGEWVFDLKKYDPLIVKGFIPSQYITYLEGYVCIVQELKRDTEISGRNDYQAAALERSKHKSPIPRSKYRKEMKKLLTNDQLAEVDLMVDNAKTTYKVIKECLQYGLSLWETGFILDYHRSLSFSPSINTLRILYFQLRRDPNLFDDALAFLEEHYDFVRERVHSSVETFMVDNHIIYEFSKMLKDHGNSFEALRMHLESCEFETDNHLESCERETDNEEEEDY